MRLINLTPHALTLKDSYGGESIIPETAPPARVTSHPGSLALPGFPVPIYEADVMGDVEGLPPPEEGVMFIVSAVVGAAVKGRHDVLVPGTGPADGAIREKGHVVAVTRLKRCC